MRRRDHKNPHELEDIDAALKFALKITKGDAGTLWRNLCQHIMYGGRLPKAWCGWESAAGYAAQRLRMASKDAEHGGFKGCSKTYRKAADALVGKGR